MNYGLIDVVVTAVRKAPSDKSEMISQLLFGEQIIIHRTLNSWLYVESVYDGSTGWINNVSHKILNQGDSLPGGDDKTIIIPRLNMAINICDEGDIIYLMPGAELFINQEDPGKINLGGQFYRLDNQIDNDIITGDRQRIKDTSITFLNSPFIWGGRTPFGIDGSGMIQVICKIHGIQLPREVSQQVSIGSVVSFIDDAEPGDLAFFDNDEGEIAYVGMIVEKGKILHASGRVRIDKVDHQGIFREETGEYSHQLRTIKNIIDD